MDKNKQPLTQTTTTKKKWRKLNLVPEKTVRIIEAPRNLVVAGKSFKQSLVGEPPRIFSLLEFRRCEPNPWCGNRLSNLYRDVVWRVLQFFAGNWNQSGYFECEIIYHKGWAAAQFRKIYVENAQDAPKYIDKFRDLMNDLLDLNSEKWKHFHKWMEKALQNNDLDLFRQLKEHPILLSTGCKTTLIESAPGTFETQCSGEDWEDWKEVYRSKFIKPVDLIQNITEDMKGYFDVLYKPPEGGIGMTYDPTALGLLMYARDAINHIAKYFKNEKPPTKSEITETLDTLFPELMQQLYDVYTYLKINMSDLRRWDIRIPM